MTENLPARMPERVPVKVNLTQPLTDLDEAMRLADALAKSDLVPSSLQGKAPSVLHVLLTGQAMGLHWSESIRVIYSPGKGQIGLRGQFLLTRLRAAGHTYKFEDGDGWSKFILTRGDTGEVFDATFTREDAAKAKLTSRDNWAHYEKRMLRWRAVAECVSFGAPDVLLGFEIEGAEEAPETSVVLRPTDPAPPEPAGEAAPGGQAAQAAQLTKLDEQMRTKAADDDHGTFVVDIRPASMRQPVSFDVSEDEPIRETLAREAEEAEIARPHGGTSGEIARPESDPYMGGIPADAPGADAPAEGVHQDFAGAAGSAAVDTTSSAPTAETATGADPDDTSGKAKTVVLAERFTALGYDPKQYRGRVLHACSVYVQRPIAGVRELRAAEVMKLTNELSAIYRRKDELAPVSRLADAVDGWEQAWRAQDQVGWDAYEEGRKT